MILVKAQDNRPAYCAIPYGFFSDVLPTLSSREFNALVHIMGICQMRASVPMRLREEKIKPRDERIVIELGWLTGITKTNQEKTVNRVFAAAAATYRDEIAAPVLLDLEEDGGKLKLTVPASLVYPGMFIKLPLPVPTGSRSVYLAWCELFDYLRHGGKKPLPLTVYLNDARLGVLNQAIGRLQPNLLRGHVRIPKNVSRLGGADDDTTTLAISI